MRTGEVTPCLNGGGGALHSPPESLERRGPGHPGFLQAGPVASLHRVGGAVHGAAVQVALCVGVATMPDAAGGPAGGVAVASCPGRRGWRQGGWWRWLQRALGLGLGRGRWRRWRQVLMGVQEAELRLPERVLVVLLMPPEVLRCFERGPVSTVAALAAARPGRHAATLRFHPGSQLRALLPSRVHHAGPRASPMLLLPPPAASGTEHRLGSASHLKLPEAQRLRGFRRPRGGSASRRGHGL